MAVLAIDFDPSAFIANPHLYSHQLISKLEQIDDAQVQYDYISQVTSKVLQYGRAVDIYVLLVGAYVRDNVCPRIGTNWNRLGGDIGADFVVYYKEAQQRYNRKKPLYNRIAKHWTQQAVEEPYIAYISSTTTLTDLAKLAEAGFSWNSVKRCINQVVLHRLYEMYKQGSINYQTLSLIGTKRDFDEFCVRYDGKATIPRVSGNLSSEQLRDALPGRPLKIGNDGFLADDLNAVQDTTTRREWTLLDPKNMQPREPLDTEAAATPTHTTQNANRQSLPSKDGQQLPTPETTVSRSQRRAALPPQTPTTPTIRSSRKRAPDSSEGSAKKSKPSVAHARPTTLTVTRRSQRLQPEVTAGAEVGTTRLPQAVKESIQKGNPARQKSQVATRTALPEDSLLANVSDGEVEVEQSVGRAQRETGVENQDEENGSSTGSEGGENGDLQDDAENEVQHDVEVTDYEHMPTDGNAHDGDANNGNVTGERVGSAVHIGPALDSESETGSLGNARVGSDIEEKRSQAKQSSGAATSEIKMTDINQATLPVEDGSPVHLPSDRNSLVHPTASDIDNLNSSSDIDKAPRSSRIIHRLSNQTAELDGAVVELRRYLDRFRAALTKNVRDATQLPWRENLELCAQQVSRQSEALMELMQKSSQELDDSPSTP